MLFQPSGGGEQFVFWDYAIVLAVRIEHGDIVIGQARVGGGRAGHMTGCVEAGQGDDGPIPLGIDTQQMHGDQPTLRKPKRHHVTVGGNVVGHPSVDCCGGGIRVVVTIIADRQGIVEPRVVAGVETALTGRRECQRPAQCHEIVIWSDEAHDVRHVFFAGSPSVQAQEQRMRGMLVEAAARGDAVLHGEWLAKTSGHSGGFAADQRLAGIRFFAHTIPI